MFILYYIASLVVSLLVLYIFAKSENREEIIISGFVLMPLVWRILMLN